MANTLAYSVIFLAVLNLTSCYHEEDLKSGIRDGIVKLYDDLKNDALNENTFDFFPKEVEEAIPQIRKYFMGKTQDSLTAQVLYMMYIITNRMCHEYAIHSDIHFSDKYRKFFTLLYRMCCRSRHHISAFQKWNILGTYRNYS